MDPLNTLLPALSLTLTDYLHQRDLVSLLILLNLLRVLYLHAQPKVTKWCTRRQVSDIEVNADDDGIPESEIRVDDSKYRSKKKRR